MITHHSKIELSGNEHCKIATEAFNLLTRLPNDIAIISGDNEENDLVRTDIELDEIR